MKTKNMSIALVVAALLVFLSLAVPLFISEAAGNQPC